MVTVDKLKIFGFGRFNNQEFELAPGLNVVFGGNEAGKSTIHSFIEAMLFGFWKPNIHQQELEPGYEKYRPWNGISYGGEMEYSWQQGRVRVVRDFASNTVSLYDLASGEIFAGLLLNSWGEPDFARLHFGCSKLVFRNTISISQLGSATDSAVAQEVRNLLSNLAQSGGSGISVKQGMEILAGSRRQIDFELVKTQALLTQTQNRLAEAKEQISEAARLEIQQYRLGRQIEELGLQRREFKDLAAKIQGQAALSKLDRLNKMRRDRRAVQEELEELGQAALDPSNYQDWRSLQTELKKVQEVHNLHVQALEEVVQQRQCHEDILQEMALYAGHNQDTLIEMSSAWQMQAKGQQVIDEMQVELEKLGGEIREVTTELSKLPYFRPDALEQAAALHSVATGQEVQGSHEELEQELEHHQRSLNSGKTLRLVLALSLPVAAASAWMLNPLLALLAIPILIGLIAVGNSIKKANLHSRNLRREIYSIELEFVNNQRAREHAQRELSSFLARAGVNDLREMETKFNAFTALSERNYELMREQKFISGKLEEFYQETEAKSQELQAILNGVGLGGLPMEQALACFRVNLDKLLDAKNFIERSRLQEEAARQRLEQSRQELSATEEQLTQLMGAMTVDSAAEVEELAARTDRRQKLEQEAASLGQRIQDLLEGITEEELSQQAAAAAQGEEFEEVQDLPDKIELLDQELLRLQSQKSEGLGRLEGIYASLPSPAELEEESWQQQEQCRLLQVNLQAVDLAIETITELAEELKNQIAPELNDMVSALVGRITGGKYNLLQVAQDMSISVTAPESVQDVDLEKLSGGTIDQFYFACRVAIADLVTGGGLPLFLDDSFVQYDDQRLQHMLNLLLELGESRQIILLTCQRRELEQLARLAPGRFRSINLDS
ncbi:MAG: AAA family ATPase [Eubacteriales bacterium]|nr:AAA family ATPase [Eubacteriales bacterium]MDD4078138.1 AAA family ATPase [Eubacteriales bacterium]